MDVNELDVPRGESVKFADVGDKVQGTVLYVGDWYTSTNNFGKERTSVKIVLETADGNLSIFPERGSTMAQAIGEAVRKAGGTKLLPGATLGVKFSSTKDVGKGNPLKLFTAVYEAPKNGAPVVDDDEEPF